MVLVLELVEPGAWSGGIVLVLVLLVVVSVSLLRVVPLVPELPLWVLDIMSLLDLALCLALCFDLCLVVLVWVELESLAIGVDELLVAELDCWAIAPVAASSDRDRIAAVIFMVISYVFS